MRRQYPPDAHPAPQQRSNGPRLKIVFFLVYVLGGIGLPLIYFLSHIRFHDGLSLIWYGPYVFLWALPIYVLDLMGRKSNRQSGKPTLDPVLRYRPMSVSQRRRRYRRLALTATIFFVAGIAGSRLYMWVANQGAGRPLPTYTLAQLQATNPKTLPRYIQIVGATMHPGLAWGRIVALKYGDELDTYMPLTTPDWTSSEPVGLIERDQFYPFNPNTPAAQQNETMPGGDIEGTLDQITLPESWAAHIARHGWRTTTPVLILQRSQLGGMVPGADPDVTAAIEIMTGMITVLFGGLALALKLSLDHSVSKL